MKNIFKQIKSIFIDNKEYFVRCTLMSIIAALIIGLAIGLSIPVLAAEEPTESDLVIIPAGTYKFKSDIERPTFSGTYNLPINVSLTLSSEQIQELNNLITPEGIDPIVPQEYFVNISFSQWELYNGSQTTDESGYQEYSIVNFLGGSYSSSPENANLSFVMSLLYSGTEVYNSLFGDSVTSPYDVFTVTSDTNVDDIFGTWFLANTELLNSSTATITAGTYFGVDVPTSGSFNVSFSFTSDSYEFDTFYVGTDYITYRMLTGSTRTVNAFDFSSDLWTINYETITVSTDQTLPADFVTWFNSNYTQQITPEPEPTYTISAGYYKARDSFTTSGWNVTNDSILIRYYNDASNVQAYKVVDGISFISYYTDSGVHYASEIYYADSAVFTDSWNIDGAKNIQVLQDVTVSSDFYTVFNNVYAPSSEVTNEFDSGYASGYVDGRSDGYDIGYRQGYAEGLSDGDTNIFVDIIGGTLSAVDSFTIFGGFSLLDLISTLLGGMALVWILKLLAGG